MHTPESETPNPPASSRAIESNESGATAVEYALMVALIALVIFGAVAAVGLNLGGLFDETATSFSTF